MYDFVIFSQTIVSQSGLFWDQQEENVPRVHCCTTKFFCRYDFSQCGIDKRRSTEKDCSYFVDDNIFLSHCRNIGPSSSTTSNHYCQLNKCYLLLAFCTRKSELVEFHVHLLQTARFVSKISLPPHSHT